MSGPTPEQARDRLLARVAARENLTEFAKFVDIPGVPITAEASDSVWDVVETPLAKHHILILQVLQDLVEDKLEHDGKVVRRVMLMFPPGSAKSTYATVVFPAWMMGTRPGIETILTGYGDTIVKRHGKRCRQLVDSEPFRELFGCGLDPQTKAANEWQSANGSSYKGAGITAGITGFRTSLLVWDDLVKGREDADSATMRNKVWNAYTDDARSRKTPGAHEVGIGTRWHEMDHIGAILPEGYAGESGFIDCRDGNTWLVVCCAAQCEREDDPLEREIGELIWPEWFGDDPEGDYWRDKRVNPRSWASLYQQRPAPEEGLYFKKDWTNHYRDLPSKMDYYISWDGAVSDADSADETVIAVWGVDTAGRIHMVTVWRARATMDVWISQLVTLAQQWKPAAIVGEGGVIRRAAEPYLSREMRARGAFYLTEYVTRSADKSAMARPAQAMMAAGQILFPTTTDADDFLDQMYRFPTAAHDDCVDTLANLCLYLEQIWAAAPPKHEPQPHAGILSHELKVSSLMPKKKSKRSKYAVTRR